MAGHSKWANIKHRKAAQDKKRGKIFTRLIRELMVAARGGGGDVNTNPSLRLAVDNARAENMPKDTMERAIKRGTGEIEGADYVEVTYEGHGPGNVAFVVKCLTDNRTRTVANIRTAFNKAGGRMGDNGAVAWMFDHKGVIEYPATIGEEDAIMEQALEAGADDFKADGDMYQIITEVEDFGEVLKVVKESLGKPEEADLGYVCKQQTPVEDAETAQKVIAMIDRIEEDDDVQTVFTSMDLPDSIAEALAAAE